MSQILDSLRAVKANYKPYDDWEQAQADDVAKRKYLSEKLDLPKEKVKETREKAKAVFRASDMMDRRSEDNCANMEQATGLAAMAITIPLDAAFIYLFNHLAAKGKMANMKHQAYFQLAQVGVCLVPAIAISLIGNAKQKESSRIGRYQARTKELQDPKNFVIYTPEQIKAAKAEAKKMPNKKDKDNRGFVQSLRELGQMYKDKPSYLEWRASRAKKSEENLQKALNTEFTPEQLQQGEEDKEIIVNIVKDVNMEAETYAENVESVFDTIDMLSWVSAAGVKLGLSKIFSKIDKMLEKAQKKPLPPEIVKYVPWIAAATLPTFIILFWGTKKKKEASRVGRFVKRKEIINNPELIMAYSEKQLKKAKDVKAPPTKKNFFQKIAFNFEFLPKYLHDLKAYKKYKKKEAQDNIKLYDALVKTDVSDAQLKAAKHLQSKTFVAFDKMDEMSQRYSEDTEAACEIANDLLGSVMSVGWIGAMFMPMYIIQKGHARIPGMHKVVEIASKIALNEHSQIRKLIHEAYIIINSDPKMKKDFSRIFFDKNAGIRLLNNPELKKIQTKLSQIILGENVEEFKKAKTLKAMYKLLGQILEKHFKQDPISKWLKNLAKEGLSLWLKSKKELKIFLDEEHVPETWWKGIKKSFKDYKTLWLTGGSLLIPFLGVFVGIPHIWNLFFTNIQIKAGRIGIMKAMDGIDNPKLFVESNDTDSKKIEDQYA